MAAFDPAIFLSKSTTSAPTFLYAPLLAYFVSVDDGHEELVRSIKFSSLFPQGVLKDIICTGNDTSAYLVLGSDGAHTSLITPSLLLKDVSLNKTNSPTDKLPILDNPAFSH